MKAYFSERELSQILGISIPATKKRAGREGWEFVASKGRGKDGKRRVYRFQSLSKEVQRKIISHQIGCAPDFIPSNNFDIALAAAGLEKWGTATKDNRKIAQARDHILNKFSQFIKSKNLKQTQGAVRFASFYNAGLIAAEPWVLEKISSVSAPSLRRWRREKVKHGLPGLLGNYGNRKGSQRAVSSEQGKFIIAHINAKSHIRSEHIFKIVCKTFETHPSRRTVYRFVKKWKQDNLQLVALIEDPRRYKNNLMPAFGDASADVPYFGHTWEIDSTPADIITKDGQRLAVIGVIDIYSRRSILLIAPVSKSIAIAAAIRKANIAWGIPSRIKMDNGADYQSFHVKAITSALKIETPELPKYSPEKKPFIERFFGTFSMGLEELLPGYCGHSVNERQALREKKIWAEKIMKPGDKVEIPLSLEEFQSLSDRFVEKYERTQHKGLDGGMPLDVAKESHLQPQKIRNERILDILLAPVGNRTVQKQGISIDASYFVSSKLINYIGRRVEIRRDLNNAGRLYVFDASTEKYLCQARNEPLEGQNLEDYQKAKKEHLKNLKEQKKALNKMGLSNRTAVQILFEDEIEHHETNVIPFQGNFENQAVEEARKAISDSNIVDVDEVPEQVSMAVNEYHSTDYLLDDSHMAARDIEREFEEMKKYRNNKIKPAH